jgi:predicted Holliday junction resolvase-like endonuclease
MKSIFMICLLFLSASLSAMPETPAEKATQQLAEYGKAFTLTSEQKAAATPVLKEYYTKRAEVKANKDITKKAEEEKIDILKAKRDFWFGKLEELGRLQSEAKSRR